MSLFSQQGEWIEGPTFRLFWQPQFLSVLQADKLFTEFKNNLNWRQGTIALYGTKHLEPRLSAFYGEPNAAYSYSGRMMEPHPWQLDLKQLRDDLEQKLQTPFNAVLCNYYRSGQDGMGWHSDDEPELGNEPNIASISLGATRRFVLRARQNHQIKRKFELSHGSLLTMAGPTQQFWQHQIPKTRRPVAERINLTFRNIKTML